MLHVGGADELFPQVCEKERYHMSFVVELVHQIYSLLSTAAEKLRFIQQLETMFSLVTLEMLQVSARGGFTFYRQAGLHAVLPVCNSQQSMTVFRMPPEGLCCEFPFTNKPLNPSCVSSKQSWRPEDSLLPAVLPELECSFPH